MSDNTTGPARPTSPGQPPEGPVESVESTQGLDPDLSSDDLDAQQEK